MALSVLHKSGLDNDKDCGVWCSQSEKWVFNGTLKNCEFFKHEVEDVEQRTDNEKWREKLNHERWKMFGK